MTGSSITDTKAYYEFRRYVSFTPSKADVEYLAANLREADKAETEATLGRLPEDLGAHLWANIGPAGKTAIVYEAPAPYAKPMLIYGVTEFPQFPGIGFVWAQGTDALVQRRFTFLRLCGVGIALLQQRYKELRCYVDRRNRLHRAWLSWVGFRATAVHTDIGPLGLPFIEYQLPGGGSAAWETLNKYQRRKRTDV